ncbi:lytic transglycosylase domain-containing protein [Burkholderia ubonensis]|uniref:lytic transglycosylase domain-containing protein n=1 Tax=Burkholderia ubonensis TaxID=101571 RepID=UPI0009B44518|nr:lytic transglycosylase domain-containing protein [Burkholderia ubonensis]
MRKILQTVFLAGLVAVGSAHADCIDDAAQHYHVNADVLRAIAYYESHLNPTAVNRDANGTVDIGLMQINSVHLSALRNEGIGDRQLMDPAINADVGASILRGEIKQYGETWRAVGAYHSRTESLGRRYADAIHRVFLERPWLQSCRHNEAAHVTSGDGVEVTSLRME